MAGRTTYRIDNKGINDPRINLALEEYILRNLSIDSDYLLIYINHPSIIIGKHQNPFQEINISYTEENQIPIIRRISGGGTVFHDKGNINFSFITKYSTQLFNQYTKFVTPVVRMLNQLKLPAALNERNDIMIENKKISGNAQFTSRDRMLSHGTLLFDSDMDTLRRSLQQTSQNIKSKSTVSVRSKVVNIKEYLEIGLPMENFESLLSRALCDSRSKCVDFELSDNDWLKVYELAEQKYKSWDWNYGQTPKFIITKEFNYQLIKYTLLIEVEKGIVTKIKCFPDDPGLNSQSSTLNQFIGEKYFNGMVQHMVNEIVG